MDGEVAIHLFSWVDRAAEYGPEKGYFKMMDGLVWLSEWQTRVLQNGYLRYYVIVIVVVTAGLVGVTAQLFEVGVGSLNLERLKVHEIAILAVLVASTLFAVLTRSRLGAVAALGSLGFTVALVYVLYSAADVGITQVLVETLTVILLVLVLFRLPGFLNLSSTALRLRDAGIALVMGGMITLLILSTVDARLFDSISQYFIDESVPSGYGRNIVNVVLVDFRALDTLGEIFVLALAAIGVYAMLRFRAEDRR